LTSGFYGEFPANSMIPIDPRGEGYRENIPMPTQGNELPSSGVDFISQRNSQRVRLRTESWPSGNWQLATASKSSPP
jgi:hypothetical protein